MSLNLRQGFAQAAQSVSNTAGQLVTDEVMQLREARMAKYQNQQTTIKAESDQALQTQKLNSEQQITSDTRAYEAEQESIRAERDHTNRLEQIKVQGQVDPRATNTVINTGDVSSAYQKEFDKGRASNDLAAYDEIKKRAHAASELEDSLSVMERLNETYKTGKPHEFAAELGRWLGTDSSKALEAFRTAAGPLLLTKLNQATGPQTDADAARMEQVIGNFGTSNEANRLAIELARKSMRRSTEQFNSMTDHLEANGNLHGYRMPTDVRVGGSAAAAVQSPALNGAADSIGSRFDQWEANRKGSAQ